MSTILRKIVAVLVVMFPGVCSHGRGSAPAKPMGNEQRQHQAHRCADRSGNQERVRPLALFVCEPGDVIDELTPVALLDQIVQPSQVRVRPRLHQHLVRAQGSFDARRIHGNVVPGLAGILDREDRARQHHLKVDFARVGIVIADGMTEQVGTHFESDVGHLDDPFAEAAAEWHSRSQPGDPSPATGRARRSAHAPPESKGHAPRHDAAEAHRPRTPRRPPTDEVTSAGHVLAGDILSRKQSCLAHVAPFSVPAQPFPASTVSLACTFPPCRSAAGSSPPRRFEAIFPLLVGGHRISRR